MALPPDGFPRAAAISPRVQVVTTTDSTNAALVAAVERDPSGHPHLSLLLTDDQRRGRGRLDRSWTAPPGTALAVSVVVRVARLPQSARGWVPLIAGAAMAEAVSRQVSGTGHEAAVKWPNDVLLDARKISGILAEVVPGNPDAIVIGAGVNTAMDAGELPVASATSFAVAGLEADVDLLLGDYLAELAKRLDALATADGDAEASGVHEWVSGRCSTLGRDVTVSLPDGSALRGAARRLDDDGRLIVDDGDREHAVSAGDIVHLR